MEMGPERSKPLHDFTLPRLRWGTQKHLRCMRLDSGAAVRRSAGTGYEEPPHRPASRRRDAPPQPGDHERRRFAADFERASRSKIGGEEGIEAVREKLTLDLKTAATRMREAILREGAAAPPPPAAGDPLPWNLRTSRAVCREPSGAAKPPEERIPGYSPPRSGAAAVKLPENRRRPKFSATLSRKQIEDDYAAMIGERPRRRPRKRPRIVQKQLDSLFPGSWLTEVSEDMYKVVADSPENGKR